MRSDFIRELLDHATGHRKGMSNLPKHDAGWWQEYRDRLRRVADSFTE